MASDIVTNYSIKIPFDSMNDIVEIVQFYSDYDKEKFLNKLIHKRREEIPHEDIFEKNNNDLYVYLFNTWKNNLLNISYDDLKSGKYDIDFDIMPVINYLKRIPDAKSKTDVDTFINPKDSEVNIFIKKYLFDSNINGICHNIDSRRLTALGNDSSIDGFLTLNIKRYDVPKFSKIFTRMCLEQSLPFSYNYNESGNINDNFVINYDKRYLNAYVQIIRDIFAKFPNLASRIGKPSYLVGCTCDNIGFAEGSYQDYYSRRAEHIEDCINDISNYFIVNNIKKKINTDLGKMSIIDYLSYEIANIISEKQCKSAIDDRSYSEYIKYKNIDYIKKIASLIKKSIDNKLKSGNPVNELIVNIDNSDIIISYDVIECVIRKSVKFIYKSYPHLYDSLKSYIKISAENIGINSDYCIDKVNTNDTTKEKIRV